MTTPVGFIGLGLLGQAMAMRLMDCGFELVVWNREPGRSVPLAKRGAVVAASPRDVAAQCDVVCLCVLDAAAVDAVVFGPQGVAAAPARRRVVLDFSTVDPAAARALAGRAAEHGLGWIDAPVSGGPPLALQGRLAVMAGGASADIEAVQALVQALAANFTHVGAVGTGQEMKLVNQALVGASFVMLAEVLALARARGLPPALVPACLRGGLADSTALQVVWPRMVEAAFDPPTGLAGQLLKDLMSVDRARAEIVDLPLPLLETSIARYRQFVQEFGESCETVSISRLYEPGSAALPSP